jgi:hypothetical protein
VVPAGVKRLRAEGEIMNRTHFDVAVSKREGGVVNLPIAQISEVRKAVRDEIVARGGPDIDLIIALLPEDDPE